MAAPSINQVPPEQHDAEVLAAEYMQESRKIIDEAAQSMQDRFVTGGRELCFQPVLLVCSSQDAEKTVNSAEPKLRSWCLL